MTAGRIQMFNWINPTYGHVGQYYIGQFNLYVSSWKNIERHVWIKVPSKFYPKKIGTTPKLNWTLLSMMNQNISRPFLLKILHICSRTVCLIWRHEQNTTKIHERKRASTSIFHPFLSPKDLLESSRDHQTSPGTGQTAPAMAVSTKSKFPSFPVHRCRPVSWPFLVGKSYLTSPTSDFKI